MFLQTARKVWRRPCLIALICLAAGRLAGAPTGPTLQLDYGAGAPLTNSITSFMYFVPLISPEQVSLSMNEGNTQCARVTTFHSRTNEAGFRVVCEVEFIGEGRERNLFDHAFAVRRRGKELKAGKALAHQLAAISMDGPGSGSVEVDGVFSNGAPVISEMRMRFNSRGHPSPVSVDLQDISLRDGSLYYGNEMVARVNMLTFRQKAGPPKMEVTLASVKRADARNSHWANFMGELKGAAANLLLPPLNITADGQRAMLDFGQALVQKKPSFTFPFAERLTNGPALPP